MVVTSGSQIQIGGEYSRDRQAVNTLKDGWLASLYAFSALIQESGSARHVGPLMTRLECGETSDISFSHMRYATFSLANEGRTRLGVARGDMLIDVHTNCCLRGLIRSRGRYPN